MFQAAKVILYSLQILNTILIRVFQKGASYCNLKFLEDLFAYVISLIPCYVCEKLGIEENMNTPTTRLKWKHLEFALKGDLCFTNRWYKC